MQPKRILTTLLAVILICLAAGLSVSAAEASPNALNMAVSVSSDAAISKAPVSVQVGDTLEVSVTVTENPGVELLGFSLVYDPAVLSVKTENDKAVYANGTVFTNENDELVVNTATTGEVVVTYLGAAVTDKTGTLLTVSFSVIGDAGKAEGKENASLSLTINSAYLYPTADVTVANEGKVSFAAHTKLEAGEKAFPCADQDFTCSSCGDIITVAGTGHHMVDVEKKDETCTEDGYTAHKKCDNAGCTYTEGYEVLEHGHKLVDVPKKDNTCTEDGYTAHKKCEREGCTYTEGYEVIEAAHILQDVAKLDPTCAKDGYEAYQACTRCDYDTKVVIPATGKHTPAVLEAVEPTYSSEGLTEGSWCSVCEKILVAQETIPAKSLLWLWILIAVVVLVAAGIVVYFFVFRKNAGPKHVGRPGSRR